MCLILLAWQVHPAYPLVVAANRDEFLARPTAAAAAWPDAPQIIAGRDLEAGGTWLGVSTAGRFAAVTNVREPGQAAGQHSRGHLTRDFLLGTTAAGHYLGNLDGKAYAGFNLLLYDGQALWYGSNRGDPGRSLPPGIYGVSNHLLDTPWPKLASAKARFTQALPGLPLENPFFDLLADDEIAADAQLPATGVSLEWERRLSAIFVRSTDYGTRASSLLTIAADGSGTLHERSFGAEGARIGQTAINFGGSLAKAKNAR
ncbi:MAG: NRDE family protein [Betaproteobacteria bacterium]|nr:NRDE family protein [Betaproteobacteria bacterium]